MDSNRFSLETVFQLRAQAFVKILEHADIIHDIAEACEKLDCAIQNALSEQNIDNQQDVIEDARRLAALLDCEVSA